MERGEQVSGSDLTMTPFAESLAESGVPITIGHRAEAVNGADLVLASSAVPASNVELEAAIAAGIPVLLVGDTAAEVILGLPGTIHAPLDFLIQITAAVKRGATVSV